MRKIGLIYHDASPQEYEILKFAVTTGYFNMASLQIAFPDNQYKTLYSHVSKLCHKDYLDVFKIGGSGKSTPNIYKITSKCGHLFSIPKSYKLKQHSEEYAKKKLIESRFIAKYFKNFSDDLLTEPQLKLNALLNFGYDKSLIPTKIGNQIYHIEEVVLLNKGNHDELTGYDFSFIGTDDIYKNIDAQVRAILKKYQNLVTQKSVKYIIVTDDVNRQKLWENYFTSIANSETDITDNNSPMKLRTPNTDYIRLYLEYLKNFREVQFVDLIKRIKAEGLSTSEIIIETSDFIKKNISTYRAKSELIEMISALSFDEFIDLIKQSNSENQSMVREYFMTAFLLQVVPDVAKLNANQIKKEVFAKFNFSTMIV